MALWISQHCYGDSGIGHFFYCDLALAQIEQYPWGSAGMLKEYLHGVCSSATASVGSGSGATMSRFVHPSDSALPDAVVRCTVLQAISCAQ